jgi:hypothetical protein
MLKVTNIGNFSAMQTALPDTLPPAYRVSASSADTTASAPLKRAKPLPGIFRKSGFKD